MTLNYTEDWLNPPPPPERPILVSRNPCITITGERLLCFCTCNSPVIKYEPDPLEWLDYDPAQFERGWLI